MYWNRRRVMGPWKVLFTDSQDTQGKGEGCDIVCRRFCQPDEVLWAVGFFFGNVEPCLELWNIIPGISGISDCFSFYRTWYQSARGRTALRRFYWWRSTIAATNAPSSIVVRPEAGA